MGEAQFWESAGGGRVRCRLCPHRCLIEDGRTGVCGVRRNSGGTLETLVWGRLIASHVDPIEKKPLFHFLPGTTSFSVATVGCNLRCRHCQNAEISQMPRDHGRVAGREAGPEEVVQAAIDSGCASISYTYTEPTVFLEYALDIAVPARAAGLRNIFVTNGFIEEKPLRKAASLIDAANVDLKSFSDDFYRKICGASLQPVLDAARRYRELGVWVEITTLVIPGLNDSDKELRAIARFIRSLGEEVPWHVSRFHPDYRLTDRPATPLATMTRTREIGREEGLLNVYQGNVPAGGGESTSCPGCGRTVISRAGFAVVEQRVENGCCAFCGASLPGVWR